VYGKQKQLGTVNEKPAVYGVQSIIFIKNGVQRLKTGKNSVREKPLTPLCTNRAQLGMPIGLLFEIWLAFTRLSYHASSARPFSDEICNLG